MSKAADNFVAKCEKFFKEADKDGNGLTVGELAKMIRKVSSVDISDAEIAEMFLDLDDNNDRIMTWDEFSDVFKKKDPKKVQESELMDAFKAMDTDGSGRLTADEIKAQFSSLGVQVTPEQLEATISNADVDGDGKIGYQEFLKAWSS